MKGILKAAQGTTAEFRKGDQHQLVEHLLGDHLSVFAVYPGLRYVKKPENARSPDVAFGIHDPNGRQ